MVIVLVTVGPCVPIPSVSRRVTGWPILLTVRCIVLAIPLSLLTSVMLVSALVCPLLTSCRSSLESRWNDLLRLSWTCSLDDNTVLTLSVPVLGPPLPSPARKRLLSMQAGNLALSVLMLTRLWTSLCACVVLLLAVLTS